MRLRQKLFLLLATAFFVTMNALLWRSEFSARGHVGAPVPAEVVWEKVLTSPDNSFLEIRHKGARIGRAHWVASIGEAHSAALNSDQPPPEGMVKTPSYYRLDFDGAFGLEDSTRVRFICNLRLDPDQNWQDLTLKLAVKPDSWEIQASAATRTLRFVADDHGGRREQSFRFEELQHPEKLARTLGGPLLPALLTSLGLPLQQATPSAVALGLHWEARNDWLTLGRNPVRVYRVEARLFDRFKAALLVSPVGEILRMELPDEIILTNEALTNL